MLYLDNPKGLYAVPNLKAKVAKLTVDLNQI